MPLAQLVAAARWPVGGSRHRPCVNFFEIVQALSHDVVAGAVSGFILDSVRRGARASVRRARLRRKPRHRAEGA